MKKLGVLSAIIAIAVSLPFNADARGRLHSSHAHASSGSPSHTGENHGSVVRSSISRHRSDDNQPGNATATGSAGDSANAEDDASLRRIREERAAARAKADAEIIAARNAQIASDEEKRRQLREQAALRAEEEQKRKDAEATLKNRELALLERRQSQADWEARCQIKPVMSDAEIATCKEVWSTAAR